MIVPVVQGGPGSGLLQSTGLIPAGLSNVLIDIVNVGQGVVYISSDKKSLEAGSSGEPIQPAASRRVHYPVSVELYALSPNAGGGSLSVEIITVPTPGASATQSFADKLKAALATPIKTLFLLLALFAVPAFAQNPNVPPASPTNLLAGLQPIGTNVPIIANTPYYWYLNPPPNASIIDIAFNGGLNTTILQISQWEGGNGSNGEVPALCITPSPVFGTVSNFSIPFRQTKYTTPVAFECAVPTSGLLEFIVTSTASGTLSAYATVFTDTSSPDIARSAGSGPFGVCTGPSTAKFVSCSPQDMNLNGVTLLASNSVESNNVDLRGVQALTFWWNCGQITLLALQPYAEDNSTPLLLDNVVDNAPASEWNQFSMTADSVHSLFGGLTTDLTYLPNAFDAFVIENLTATATTCTARLFLQY